MNALNLPIEMISICYADGQLRPLRFRYEDNNHSLFTVKIAEILVARELNYVGRQFYQYICKALSAKKEMLFELRYEVKNHRWTLFRFLN